MNSNDTPEESCRRCDNSYARSQGAVSRSGPICPECVAEVEAQPARQRGTDWDRIDDRQNPDSHRFSIQVPATLIADARDALASVGVRLTPERDIMCAREYGHEAFTGDECDEVAEELRDYAEDRGPSPAVPPFSEAWSFATRWQLLDLAT